MLKKSGANAEDDHVASVRMATVTAPLPAPGGQPLGPASIGEAIRLLRHRARLTRDALAERAGVSAGAISNYENDVSAASANTLRRLALVFSETLDIEASELWEQFGSILDQQSRREAAAEQS